MSYRGLNKVSKIYKYPLPRCDMAITIFEIGSTCIYVNTVDAKQGYRQISVRECDVDKLAFFVPDNKKYGFTVILFGPVNTPSFYSCLMGAFKTEWTYSSSRNFVILSFLKAC